MSFRTPVCEPHKIKTVRLLSFPNREERKKIAELNRLKKKVSINQVVSIDQIMEAADAAEKIRLDEDGEGRSRRDIVTYPGGDRVDWKVFQVPEGKDGILQVKIKYRPARPGMDSRSSYVHRQSSIMSSAA